MLSTWVVLGCREGQLLSWRPEIALGMCHLFPPGVGVGGLDGAPESKLACWRFLIKSLSYSQPPVMLVQLWGCPPGRRGYQPLSPQHPSLTDLDCNSDFLPLALPPGDLPQHWNTMLAGGRLQAGLVYKNIHKEANLYLRLPWRPITVRLCAIFQRTKISGFQQQKTNKTKPFIAPPDQAVKVQNQWVKGSS